MKKTIVVFTNNNKLRDDLKIRIGSNIRFPLEVIINENFSVILADDQTDVSTISSFTGHFNEFYVVYHNQGSTDREKLERLLGSKLKNKISESHMNNSGNFYDKQLRQVLETENEVNEKNNYRKLKITIDENFLLEPFNDGGLEMTISLLKKLLAGNFALGDEERSLLKENDFNLTDFQKNYEQNNTDWESFNQLRNKLTSNL